LRIDALKHPMQKLDTPTPRNGFEPAAHLHIGNGSGKEPSRERAVVKTGSADNNRPASAVVNILNCRHRVAHVLRCCVLFGRLDDIDEMVRSSAALCERNFVGSDVEATVNGSGIAADNLAAAPECQLDAECAFACGSRAQDGEDRRAQTLHPEESQSHGGAEKNQQAELLRAGRERHPLTGNPQGPHCRGTSP